MTDERVTVIGVALLGAGVLCLAALHIVDWLELHTNPRPWKAGR